MTILGYETVEIENVDTSLCWHIFAPSSPPGGRPLIRLSYRAIFDVSTIEHDNNLMNALAACVCYIGIPTDEVLTKLFEKFPEIKSKPVHDYCTWAMTKSRWATKESNERATGKTGTNGTGNSNKTKKKVTKKKETVKTTEKNVGQSKKTSKSRKRQLDEVDEFVEVDENGNSLDDSMDYDTSGDNNKDGRSEELVFEMVEIPARRRKLNI